MDELTATFFTPSKTSIDPNKNIKKIATAKFCTSIFNSDGIIFTNYLYFEL